MRTTPLVVAVLLAAAPLAACDDGDTPEGAGASTTAVTTADGVIALSSLTEGNVEGLQAAFNDMLEVVATRWADEPAVIGFELFNEPTVGEDDVDAFAGHRLRLGDAAGDADDGHVGFAGEHRGQRIGEELVVLDEQDTNRFLVGGHEHPLVA